MMTKSNVMAGFELNEANDKAENDKLNGKAPKATKAPKAPKVEAPVEAQPKPEAKVIDITPILAALPTDKPVTPGTLDKLFNLNDGGKTVRRHLRKHYPVNHEHKANWAWATTDPMLAEIIKYFASKYSVAK